MNPRKPLIATAAALGALAFAGSASAATTTFSNAGSISPHDHIPGGSNPGVDGDNYPSSIGVHGLPGSITHVQVTLNDVSSTFPGDLDVMLLAPDDSSVVLMSDTGRSNDLVGTDLTFDDGAASALPDDAPVPSGTYRPTNLPGDADEFPEFAGASGPSLSEFSQHDPNGTWRLLVVDDASGDISSVAGGWKLTLTTTTGAIARSRTKINGNDRPLDTEPPALAEPYPSDIDVAGVPGTIGKVTVTLHRVVANHPEDADVMLVAPDGRSLILLSDAFNNSIDGSITFDGGARFPAPKQQQLHQSAYSPANYDSGQPSETGGDAFPAPAPASPGVNGLGDFRGMSPDGKWRLFVTDDHADNVGVPIENGWSLNFTTNVPKPVPTPTPTPTPKPKPKPQPVKPALTSLSLKAKRFTATLGTNVKYGLSANAQVRFRVQRRTAAGKFKTLRGTIEKSGLAGVNRLKLRGKVGGKRLKPGSYRLTASIAGGNSRKVRFRIVKAAS